MIITREAARKEDSDSLRHFQVSTERIRKLDLPRRLTLHFKQRRTSDKHSEALRSRGCDVESVRTVEELHTSRRILWR